jgi:hypothetical protein
MDVKGLGKFINNCRSASKDPGASTELLRDSLLEASETLEKMGGKYFAYPDHINGIVGLMLRIHAMGKAEVIKPKEEETENNIVDLKLLQGGKEPPKGDDWLSKLDEHTLFFVQRQNAPMEFSLGLFWKETHEGKVVKLRSPMLPEALYVNPIRFCNVYTLYENCGIVDYKQEEVTPNDQPNRVEGTDPVERPEGQQG